MLGNTVTSASSALAISLTVGITSLLFYLFVLRKKKNFVAVCRVKKLFIYPVKGVKGVEVDRLQITGDVVKYATFRDRYALDTALPLHRIGRQTSLQTT